MRAVRLSDGHCRTDKIFLSFWQRLLHTRDSAWFSASTRPRSFEGTGRQGSDLLTPGQKPAKVLKLLNPDLGNR